MQLSFKKLTIEPYLECDLMHSNPKNKLMT